MQVEFLNTASAQLAQSNAAQGKLAAAKAGLTRSTTGENKAMREAAQDFEAIFIAQMLTPMFETVETDGLMGGGHAEGIYRSMMIDAASKEMARAGGIGIADNVYQELLKLQEV